MTTNAARAEDRLAKLGIHLPDAPTPFGAYAPAVQTGNLLFLKPGNLAARHKVGQGDVLWIPSPIGCGAWLGDRRPLAELLGQATADFLPEIPFRFSQYRPGLLLRFLQHGKSSSSWSAG